MMLDVNTFGETPGAMYLARVLNQLDDRSYSRTVAKRINAVAEQVNDLVEAYHRGISARTVANSLRLMRSEVANEVGPFRGRSLYALADQLRRNVQIGAIKRGMRLTSMARKAEKVMENPEKRAMATKSKTLPDVMEYFFRDNQSGAVILAGYGCEDLNLRNLLSLEEVCDKTPELLVRRSDARCKRLRKPHTLGA